MSWLDVYAAEVEQAARMEHLARRMRHQLVAAGGASLGMGGWLDSLAQRLRHRVRRLGDAHTADAATDGRSATIRGGTAALGD